MEFRTQRVVTQTKHDEEERSNEFLRRQVLGPDAKLLPVLRVVDCPWG